jgi:short-subunit dehydrogenase
MEFSHRYGPWAVVAGASEGTGREFARQIAARGLPSILIARRPGPLAALADEIRAESGIECVTATIDLAAPDAAAEVLKAVADREVGLFVANAGSDPNGSRFLDLDLETWMQLIRRNVMTAYECSYYFASRMRERRRGGLLLVNSGACYGGASFLATYSATKAFMLCFAEGLWAELKPHGVDVLTLVMSTTDTPEFRRLLKAKGMPVFPGLASAREVAALGLARLAEGPVVNWGAADDAPGLSSMSAKERRERILAVDEMTKSIFGS